MTESQSKRRALEQLKLLQHLIKSEAAPDVILRAESRLSEQVKEILEKYPTEVSRASFDESEKVIQGLISAAKARGDKAWEKYLRLQLEELIVESLAIKGAA